MDVFEIIWSNDFKIELRDIYFYISDRLKNPDAAKRLYFKVINQINGLTDYYESYPKVPIPRRNYRKMLVNKYVVI